MKLYMTGRDKTCYKMKYAKIMYCDKIYEIKEEELLLAEKIK